MPDQIILDSQSRIELALKAPYHTTTLRWHHDTRTLSAYKVRLGGGSHSTGQYIPTLYGSKNTENLNTLIPPGTIIETTLVLDDLLVNDNAADGARTLYIYGRDQATGEWLTLISGALSVLLYFWRRPPQVSVEDLVLVNREIGSDLVLSAAREFKVTRQDGSLPAGGWTQAVEVAFDDLGASGHFTSTQAVCPPHTDGAGPIPTTVTLPTNDLGLLNVLTEREQGDIRFLVEDAFGQQELQILSIELRVASPFPEVLDPRYRDAVPPRVRDKDPILTHQYLPVWDAVAGQFDHIIDGMASLIDPETAPLSALPFLFKEMGLIYPNVPGYPEANLRRLLRKADEIHRSRFTENGLKFYLGLLVPDATVTITGVFKGAFLFCNSSVLGLPTLTQINSAGTPNDSNIYLFGPTIEQLTITFTGGNISAEMQEFIRSTIRRELLYADDPINPKSVTLAFVP